MDPGYNVSETQSREMAQTSDLILRLKSKHVLTARCLMSLIGFLASIEKMVPEGRPHMRPFQFHLKEQWRFPQSLDSLLPWTETISPHLQWWQNPTNVMKGAIPKYPTLYRRLKRRLGRSLRASLYKGSVVRQGKRATHKCSTTEGGFSGPSKVQGPVSKPNSVDCYRQLNSSSLHKQTRRNPLRRDVRCPVEDHDLVPSLLDILKSQTHSRVSERDGRPSVQVEPCPVNTMVTASAGVQTDLSTVVHSSCRSICHLSEPQTSTVRISSPRPKCLGHRCSEHKLVGSHCLCLPSHGFPSQGDPKNQAIQLSDHYIIFAFSAVRHPASHLVSRHFRQQFLSYLYQIWHAGLLG